MKELRIGWIGTGVMGLSMAGRLLDAGFEKMTLHNRTKSKAATLLERGAAWAESPAELAPNCDVVFLMVGFPEDVRNTVFGKKCKDGLLENLAPGSIIVDMSTSRPELAEEISRAAAKKGLFSLDAPVTGGDIGAKNGTLSIMVGGDKEIADRLSDCWNAMGKLLVYHGPSGSGQHAKMSNQILIAANMCGVCESLLYAQKAGLNLEKVLESVSAGAAGSWMVSNMAPRIIKGDFKPGFYVEHMIKDIGIALDEAKRLGIALPGLALFHQLYLMNAAQGHSRDGTQSLFLTLAEINRVTPAGSMRSI